MDNALYSLGVPVDRKNYERQKDDYYATEPQAAEDLLEREKLTDTVLEPSVGGGHIAKVLQAHGKTVIGMDIVNRGWGGYVDTRFLEV